MKKTLAEEVAERQRMRDEKLRLLGPRPPWWRPFKRRRWQREHRAIMAIDVSEAGVLLRAAYSDVYADELARRPHPSFAFITKAEQPMSGDGFVYSTPVRRKEPDGD